MSKKKISKEKEVAIQKLIIGHFVEEIPKDCKKKICYVLQGDGLWEVRTNRLGVFTSHVNKFNVPGLVQNMQEGWELNVPRIPVSVLVQIVSFFRKINRVHDSEVFVQVFYDFDKEEYFAHVPIQEVSGASVNYRNDNEFERDNSKILVFEIHSHNTMPAFFSSVDDEDEKSDRFYGVVGKLKDYYPQMLIRLSVGGRRESVDVQDLFDIDSDETHYAEIFPKEWEDKVSKRVVRTSKGRGGKKVYVPVGSPYSQDGQQLVLEDDISSTQESFYGEDRCWWDDLPETSLMKDEFGKEIYADKPPAGEKDDWHDLMCDDDDEDGVPSYSKWRNKRF